MRCPIHGDRNASATINFDKGLFHCNKPGCQTGKGMTTARLKKMILDRQGEVGAAEYDPFATEKTNVVDLATKRAQRTVPDPEDGVAGLSETLVLNYHRNLMANKELLQAFKAKRGLTDETIKQYQIGFESRTKRYTIPIRDANGAVVNIRKYQIGGDGQKMINHMTKDGTSYGSPPRLFPIAVLDGAQNVIICEGELDALMAIQNGFNAISGTGGASKWLGEWAQHFAGMNVTTIYDNDQEGRLGAARVRAALKKHAATVRSLDAIVDAAKGDVTDYFLSGGTARLLRQRLSDLEISADASTVAADPEAADASAVVGVIGTMQAASNGKPLSITATITGRKDPTYSIPKQFTASCSLDYGPKCKVCPMLVEHEGEVSVEVGKQDLDLISRFIERGADDRAFVVMQTFGVPTRCTQFNLEVEQQHTVEELFITSSVDTRKDEEADYTQRRIFNFGDDYATQTNTVANLAGSTWPSPKTSKNEFYSWDLEPAVTSIDQFEVTDDFIKRMQKFRPTAKQRPMEKCRDIAKDMAFNVTGILGRERMHIAMDLVWHSPLRYIWRGQVYRGWLELVLVGDTRTGKSQAARALSRHYQLGHVISCEGATFAGLIGGAKQVGEQWTIQWGEYTINDRRLVVLDEVSGLSHEIIALMSDVRSSGEAQINKIEHGRTSARVRSIWISNPRQSKYVDEKKTLGIDIVQDVIGNPEDIARFDIAMSVREEDVGPEIINTSFERGDPKYSSQDCQDLLLWVWSRRAEDVYFKDDAVQQVFDNATELSKMYVLKPGLLQLGNAHEKISRVAAAIAARTFSTDDTATKIVVERSHVMDAAAFLHRLYSYDNFGYYRRSQRVVRNREIAKENRNKIRKWLLENTRVLEFLLDRTGSFRSQDMEEMAHMDRDEVRIAMSVLSEAKMINKDKSQIVMEPELQDLLAKEFKHK